MFQPSRSPRPSLSLPDSYSYINSLILINIECSLLDTAYRSPNRITYLSSQGSTPPSWLEPQTILKPSLQGLCTPALTACRSPARSRHWVWDFFPHKTLLNLQTTESNPGTPNPRKSCKNSVFHSIKVQIAQFFFSFSTHRRYSSLYRFVICHQLY